MEDRQDIDRLRGQLQVYEELLTSEPGDNPAEWARRCRFLREINWPKGDHIDPETVRSVRSRFEEVAEQTRRDLHLEAEAGNERAIAVLDLLADDAWWSTNPEGQTE